MQLLKQATAATIKLGPFVDSADAVTPETGLTISQADIRLSKNGGDFTQSNNSAGATHDEHGYYDVTLDTTDTDTLGRLRVAVNESGALPVWQEFLVVPANVYDALVSGSDRLQVDAHEIEGVDATQQLAAAASAGAAAAILAANLPSVDDLPPDPPTAAEIDTQLSGTHGAGQWGPAGASGAYTVTVTVVDDTTDAPLPEALVTVRTEAGTLHDQGRTDGDGEFTTPANNGDYTATVSPLPGYSGATDQAFTVNGAAVAVEVRLPPIAVSAPPAADFCTVYVDVYDDADHPAAGVLVTAMPASLPLLLASVILSGEERTATTSALGRAELQLARGKRYRVRLKQEGINQVITVPDQASANLRELL